ncbi:MAG: peptidoglycan bridge formation glycyltransferase FemA/FemB family protein [Chloroflexota bacterium]|nr:MAG: peptidoglycan bridge formation glycyltransferase FemA/FemB family protein [Chloroflexota bacterium]
MPILSLNEWKEFLSKCPDAHLLQTGAWGELKSVFGWQAVRLVVESESDNWGAQILFRKLPLDLTLAYIPKGPVLQGAALGEKVKFPGQAFWTDVDQLCRARRAIFLKVEPDHWYRQSNSDGNGPPAGFQESPHAIQPMRTIIVDLQENEEEILARMKQKTRYNIRLASKKGVEVNPSADLETFFDLLEATGERDQFGIHSYDYYRTAYDLFKPDGDCELFIAKYGGEPIAGLMVFLAGHRSWYLYGASQSLHRERMPTYLLQWEAMKWARMAGCFQYDLWGIPDFDEQVLEAEFANRSDGLWGIYRFKRGFGGEITRSVGPWDRVYQPILYKLYLRWVGRGIGEL